MLPCFAEGWHEASAFQLQRKVKPSRDSAPSAKGQQFAAGFDMGLFLISQIPWGSNAFEFDTLRCPRPLQICFPGYQIPELMQVTGHSHLTHLMERLDVQSQGGNLHLNIAASMRRF